MSLGSIVGLVAGKIGDLLVEEAKFLYGVEDQVRSLRVELMMMNVYVQDMDEEGGDERTRTTIKLIRRIAYDAEDVVDSYIQEANSPSSNNKAEEFLKRYACFCISLPRTHQFGSEVEAIKARIDQTTDMLRKYGGENGVIRADAGAGPGRGWRRQIAYPQTNEDHVVGLVEDINKLVGVLTTDDTDIQVLSVVGMGGSGKTTLARKLYNHESVKKHFDRIAWVSVSKEWVAQQILLELLRQTSGETIGKDEAWSSHVLTEKLHQYLEGKTYLIFLDDVWTKEALEGIFSALPSVGRRIIVTTRKREVIDFPDLRCSIHEPRRLTEDESWELFTKMALLHMDPSKSAISNNVFESSAKEMLKKCEGLPLAVIALAGILGKKETIEQWEKVSKAVVSSRIMEEGRGTHSYGPVNKMLGLSFEDLPRKLKPCFLYLAMFPEDHIIYTGELIRMWIAEGFIASDMLQEGETLEDVGRDYLGELIQRCVVQIERINDRGKVRSIRVHDLVRDLCIKKAKDQDFLEICTCQSSNLKAPSGELRRTAIYSFDNMYLPLPKQSPHLRSLLYQDIGRELFEGGETLRLQDICQNFVLLRVLSLKHVRIAEGSLPTGIGNLIHLKYLGLRWININSLPSSIGKLRNLLTLDCQSWYKEGDVFKVPESVWEIEGLRHLHLHGQSCNEGRVKVHRMKELRTLKGVKGGEWMVEELPRLSPTVEKLCIRSGVSSSIRSGVSSKEQVEAVFRCPSIASDKLRSLQLGWFFQGEQMTLDILQPIVHSQRLRKLHLRGRIEERWSSSCNNSNELFPSSITKLVLVNTGFEEEATLAAIGELPNLVSLKLDFYSYRGTKWGWIAGQFSKLKHLQICWLRNWEEWSVEEGAMPQLTELRISYCWKLRRLPEGLRFITTLKELRVSEEDGGALEKRIKGGEDAHIVKDIPRVHIYQYPPHVDTDFCDDFFHG